MATRTEPLSVRLKASGDLKLVPYLMAGHPTPERSASIAKRLATSGAAALEIGIPFSDPLADGPVIQRAGQVALDHGMSVARALDLAADVAEEGGAPVVLMTYVNPVLAYDPRRFAADAAQAGVAGVIFPDLPAEEAEPVAGWMRSAGGGQKGMTARSSIRPAACRMAPASTGPSSCGRRSSVARSSSPAPWRLNRCRRRR